MLEDEETLTALSLRGYSIEKSGEEGRYRLYAEGTVDPKTSLFARRHGAECDFRGGEGWVVLSPVERSIREKIEKAGTPLKKWDIRIYRGVLTGCNEAFIISTKRREEILADCGDEAERSRTAALIRPILRGRDIKRYSCEWAGLWLIATFPAKHYDIEMYPAVKRHLLSFARDALIRSGNEWVAKNHLADFCRQKLLQEGKFVQIDGKYVLNAQGQREKGRKKTSNKWFETQDSISYWEDFEKPKIVYPETTLGAYFVYDQNDGYLIDKTCFMLISAFPLYLQSILSSKLFEFVYKKIFSSVEIGENGYQYNKHALIKLPIIECNTDYQLNDDQIYDLYRISPEERASIEDWVKSNKNCIG